MRTPGLFFGLLVAASLALASPEVAAKGKAPHGPRFFFQVRGVKELKETKPSRKELVKKILLEELKLHPEVVTDLGEDVPKDGPELSKLLKKRGLKGFDFWLLVRKVEFVFKTPEAGKKYRMLTAEVDVAIEVQTIPMGEMSLAGEGNSQVGTETAKDTEKERGELLGDAVKDACKQAIVKSITKLSEPPKKAKKAKKK
jgi:hypothetical protein